MSDDDELHRFLKGWARNFLNRDDPPDYGNLERREDYEDWSKRFLSHYEKKESEKEAGGDSTIASIEKFTSDFLSYLDEVEESRDKKERKR